MTDTAVIRPSVRPKPCAVPSRSDLVFASRRPITTVAIAFADKEGLAYRYHAASTEQTFWSGLVHADTVEAAVLDVIRQVLAASPGTDRVRFVVRLPAKSPLWRHAPEIGALLSGVSVEMPGLHDQDLIETARAALAVDTPAPVPDSPPQAPAADLSPVWVATDGSVRRKITGWGWLASDGAYGLQGFRHSTKQIGTEVVLISELRAIGQAVRKLQARDITVLSDSKPAVAMVKNWLDGDDVLPDGYITERGDGKEAGLVTARRSIRAQRDRLTLVWAKGHQGEPLNEGADALARLASRYAARTSELTNAEYHRRAADLAKTFAAQFNRLRAA